MFQLRPVFSRAAVLHIILMFIHPDTVFAFLKIFLTEVKHWEFMLSLGPFLVLLFCRTTSQVEIHFCSATQNQRILPFCFEGLRCEKILGWLDNLCYLLCCRFLSSMCVHAIPLIIFLLSLWDSYLFQLFSNSFLQQNEDKIICLATLRPRLMCALYGHAF